MSNLKFAETHNLVAFLEKPKESDGFKGIIDFLNASSIRYALTMNTTIYTSCVKQFWATAKAKTVNGEVQIQALVDGKKVIITETSLTLMGYENLTQKLTFYKAFFSPQWKFLIHTILQCISAKTTVWNEFSSTMASTVICLATNKNLTFPKPITDEVANAEHVPTHYNDPLFSCEDRLQLKELLELCTKFSERVLDLENTKTFQAAEITKLKERVKKLERRNKSRTPGLKRLRKVGRSAQVISSEDEGLGGQEDASKQGRKIVDLDADAEEVEDEKIKAAKPKVVTTAATTTTTDVTRPKARGVAKDKGKAKMIKLEKPLKKKDQILIDEEIAQKLQAQLNAKLEEEEKLAKQKEEDTNIVEWSKMFVELIDKRKKHFERLRAEEQRIKPPTKAQKRNTELVKESSKKAEMVQEISSKRAGEELESDNSKKQKLDESVEVEVDDEAEMKKHMEIVSDDEVAIDAIPLATKPPIIIDWKIIKEVKMGYFQIIRADGSLMRYSSMIKML
ncbi:hypothetical protein Tco_0778515 [Tanacetum coccineum]